MTDELEDLEETAELLEPNDSDDLDDVDDLDDLDELDELEDACCTASASLMAGIRPYCSMTSLATATGMNKEPYLPAWRWTS